MKALKQLGLTFAVAGTGIFLALLLTMQEFKIALAISLAAALIWGLNMFFTHLVNRKWFGFKKGYGSHLLALMESVYPGWDLWDVKILPKYDVDDKRHVLFAFILSLYGAFDIGALVFLTFVFGQLLLRII